MAKSNSALRYLEARALSGVDTIWTTHEILNALPQGVLAQISGARRGAGFREGEAVASIRGVPIKVISIAQ